MTVSSTGTPSLRERIFPTGRPRDGLIMQTAHTGSWGSQFAGLGRLTAFTSDQLLRFSAALDDIGLSVIFLQRHRVEVGLKLLLERGDASQIRGTHDLMELADACETTLRAAGHTVGWTALYAEHGQFIELLNEADPGSFGFRYPTDKCARVMSRPELIDLQELQVEGARYHAAVDQLVTAMAVAAGLEMPMGDIDIAAVELADAVRAMNGLEVALDAIERALDQQWRFLGARQPEPTARLVEAQASASAQVEISLDLKRRLKAYLDLLVAMSDSSADPRFDVEAAPVVASVPPPVDVHPVVVKTYLDERVDWAGRLFGDRVRALGQALRPVYHRSAAWPGHAPRQLHADVARFLSRVYVNLEPPGAPPTERTP